MDDSELSWDNLRDSLEAPLFTAFIDPALKEATEYSEVLAMQLNELARTTAVGGGQDGEIGRATNELDSKVTHIIGDTAVVTGPIQLYDPELGDEGDFIEAEGRAFKFNGFVCSVRAGRIEFDYQFKAFLDESGALADADYEGGYYGDVFFQARPNQVSVDMDIKHPLQAYAWLEMIAPEVMSELDALLLEDDTTFGADKLDSLSDFSLVPSRYVNTPRAETQFLNAVMVYVESFVKVNQLIPYRVDVSGKLLAARSVSEGYIYEPQVLEAKDRLFSIEQPFLTNDTQENESEERYVFAAHGVLHATEHDEPGQIVFIKLKRLTNIRSIR